jgi:hypothetical protein
MKGRRASRRSGCCGVSKPLIRHRGQEEAAAGELWRWPSARKSGFVGKQIAGGGWWGACGAGASWSRSQAAARRPRRRGEESKEAEPG